MLKKICAALLLTSTFTAYAADMAYIGECPNYAYNRGMKHVRLSETGNFTMQNETDQPQQVMLTIKVCSPVNECESKTINHVAAPHSYYISSQIALTILSQFSDYGSYNYRTYLDVTGYKTLHAEKDCVVRFVK